MHRRRLGGIGAFIGLAGLLPGCGGGDLSVDLRLPPEKQQVIEVSPAEPVPLHLPGDRPFNIHLKQSSQNPGPDGTAAGESGATPTGDAFCTARAANDGSSAADFHVGHRVDNRSGRSLAVDVQVRFDLAHSISASPPPAPESLATASLYLLITDTRHRTVGKLMIVEATSDQASAGASTKDQRTVKVVFDPGVSYDVMLYGKVDARADEGHQVEAWLDVKQLQMTLTFAPVQTQPAGN